jgi:hypothetical protein
MAATARLIVMMEAEEKAALDAQADRANVSTAEFVRRRLRGRGEPEEQAFLQTLAALKPIVRKACKTIDANLAEIRGLRESGDARTAHVASHARSELTRQELESIADRLDLLPRSAARRRRARR